VASNRKTFIINPKFQFKFSFIICSLVFLGSLIYPITIYELFDYIVVLNGKIKALDPNAQGLGEDYKQYTAELLQYLMIIQGCFIGLIFIICLFVSHKIAGPMYKLTQYLQNFRDNNGQSGELTFRDADEFKEVAEEVNQTISFLSTKSEDEIDYLKEISVYIENITLVVPEDKKPVLDEIRKKLKEFEGLN